MTRQSTIVPLDRLAGADRARAGGKAFNCARLRQAGFPVPDGLVVLTTAGDADIETAAAHSWFDSVTADVRFAVRSSGTAEDGEEESFAGIHETRLGVARQDVPAAIAACRASAWSAQAREYRRARGLTDDMARMGVLVQRMVRPVSSGVAFTVNPVTGAADEMVINASWGLGEALVSGQVDPDEFVVGKATGEIRWSRVGDKSGDRPQTASLSVAQIADLRSLLLSIEREYGAPQDVEWCHDGHTFWIVQSRPVTARRAPAGDTEWTRANLAEVFPDITSPQALSAYEDLLEAAERRYLGSLAAPEEELGPIVKSFHGRLYFNLAQLRRVCTLGGVAPAVMLKSMGHADAIHPGDEAAPRPSWAGLSHLPTMLRMVRRHMRAARIVAEHEVRTRAYVQRFTASNPRSLPDREIWSGIEEWFREAPEYMQTVLLLGGVLFHEAPVWKACARAGFPFEQLVYPQLAAGTRSVSAQQAFDLVALADIAREDAAVCRYLLTSRPTLPRLRAALQGTAFLAAFERFLEKYGHRGRYEYDWSLPRYREDPTPLLQTLRAHLADRPVRQEQASPDQREREAERAWAAFEARLSVWQRLTLLPGVRRAVRTIKQYYVWREQVRSDLVHILAVLRAWHLVLAERFVERGWLSRADDYFLIRYDEIAAVLHGAVPPDSLHRIVVDRRDEREGHRRMQLPLLMRVSELPALIRGSGLTGGAPAGGTLTGQPVSVGAVEAEVVVVRDPGDFSRMKRGCILVAPATDPSWTPLFTLAAGVIVEIGGVLSHASTIAREYGLPALANVKNATRLLRTGERIRLDATTGRIDRLRPAGRDPLSGTNGESAERHAGVA